MHSAEEQLSLVRDITTEELETQLSGQSDEENPESSRARWPKALIELSDVLDATFKKSMNSSQAIELADEAIIAIAHHMGGRMFYLPRDDRLKKALRDRRIWQEFNGRNIEELAERYGLTTIWLYEIIRSQRRLHKSRKQKELF